MIKEIAENDIHQLALLHKRILPSFLSTFSISFITKFYKCQLERDNQLLIGYFEQDKLIGFVFGTDDVNLLYSEFINQNKFYFYTQTLISFLKNPKYLLLFLAKFTSESFTSTCQRQLVYIGVDNKTKQKGIGSQLLKYFENQWKEFGYYELEVESENPALQFYKRNNFKIVHTYNNWVEKKLLMGKTLP
ncbi:MULTISPECIES: GNAT family N-acetyltransferase [Amniculibacterium]|jgi:ribosomal protein S18 acetylase RimI-like enzyme|uniref:GNAT family N-acetyltransferase n=1 Tax=Amniculibacterium TaxID=2715289 RepID=UPI000F5A4D7B|nr:MULTISPECIES: GNAT family N-acetyltransferase [Amniculibacterium]